MKIKLHAKDLRDKEWQEHKDFLAMIKVKVQKINEKFNYNPNTDSFNNKKPH